MTREILDPAGGLVVNRVEGHTEGFEQAVLDGKSVRGAIRKEGEQIVFFVYAENRNTKVRCIATEAYNEEGSSMHLSVKRDSIKTTITQSIDDMDAMVSKIMEMAVRSLAGAEKVITKKNLRKEGAKC